MNILVLPLYRRADQIQIQARDTENKLKDVVAHIKKTFSGDERAMILQTYYRPMLLVKDFGAKSFTTDDTFITNGDVPTITLEGLMENPVNPFTGKPINSDYKLENDKHYVLLSQKWEVEENNGKQFLEDCWAAVSGNVGDKESWTYYDTPSVFPPGLEADDTSS